MPGRLCQLQVQRRVALGMRKQDMSFATLAVDSEILFFWPHLPRSRYFQSSWVDEDMNPRSGPQISLRR